MDRSTRLALVVRILIALCTRTFFQPDEYFQSLEPAHHFVFGYGILTWEWTALQPIRSFFYPAFSVVPYWLLKVSGLSEAGPLGDWLLIALPKIVHGSLAALTDIHVGKLARLVLGADYVTTALLLSLTSLFHALALSRSLSNSLETSFTTVAFSYYPWDASPNLSPHVLFNRPRLRKLMLFSALACMTRPTNAVIWVFLYAKLLFASYHHRRIMRAIGQDMAIAGALSLTFLVLLDSFYYGKLTFTPFNFLRTNISAVSLFYGANSWHYYLTQAIPILCTTALPFTLHGIWVSISSKGPYNQPLNTMLHTIMWTVGIYSLAGHKEWRFIHPILPLLHLFAAKSLVDLQTMKGSKLKARQRHQAKFASLIRQKLGLPNIPTRYLVLVLGSFPISFYIIFFYCSGPVSVLSFFRAIPKAELNVTMVGVLMPCHSMPGFSYLHRSELSQGKLWALGCEPPLEYQDLTMYRDQADIFFSAPRDYLLTYFPTQVNLSFPLSPFPSSVPGLPLPQPTQTQSGDFLYPWKHEWPHYLVLFGQLLQEGGVKSILEQKGYKEVWKSGLDWEGEGQRKGGARVWQFTQ